MHAHTHTYTHADTHTARNRDPAQMVARISLTRPTDRPTDPPQLPCSTSRYSARTDTAAPDCSASPEHCTHAPILRYRPQNSNDLCASHNTGPSDGRGPIEQRSKGNLTHRSTDPPQGGRAWVRVRVQVLAGQSQTPGLGFGCSGRHGAR
jgi:hypothetical protein